MMETAHVTSIRAFLANTIGSIRYGDLGPTNTEYADALLASPELAAILDAAAAAEDEGEPFMHMEPEMRALLADWRANR